MNDLSLLRAAAFKTELAASQRLMMRAGLSELEALTRHLLAPLLPCLHDHAMAARA